MSYVDGGHTAYSLYLAGIRRCAEFLRPILPATWTNRLAVFGRVGYWLNVNEPRTLSEKIHWIMQMQPDPSMVVLADKLRLKEYARRRFPALKTARVFSSSRSAAELEFSGIPDRVVMKANFGSGMNAVLDRPFDLGRARKLADRWLDRPPYGTVCEWHYDEMERRVFLEEYLQDGVRDRPMEVKVFVMGGEPQVIQVNWSRDGTITRVFKDLQWVTVPIRKVVRPGERPRRINENEVPPAPKRLSELIGLSRELSTEFQFVRVDFFLVGGCPYLSELTFSPEKGLFMFEPRAADAEMGSLLTLDTS